MAERYEADEAILRVEVPRIRQDLVAPAVNAATTEEPVPGDETVEERVVSVELTADGAQIHLT